jgi:hypothetical protein
MNERVQNIMESESWKEKQILRSLKCYRERSSAPCSFFGVLPACPAIEDYKCLIPLTLPFYLQPTPTTTP